MPTGNICPALCVKGFCEAREAREIRKVPPSRQGAPLWSR
jgi:hypothetical protein